VKYAALKAEGHSQREIARELGIPESTLRRLVKRGHPPSTVHGATDHRPPSTVDRPPATVDPLPSTVDRPQADIGAALALALQPVLDRLAALEIGLLQRPANGTPSTVHHNTVDGPPTYPDTSTVHPATVDPQTWELRQLKHSERWTVYVPRAMKEELKQRAAARGLNPSLLVQEALQQWLRAE
jgi:hypothetical protein